MRKYAKINIPSVDWERNLSISIFFSWTLRNLCILISRDLTVYRKMIQEINTAVLSPIIPHISIRGYPIRRGAWDGEHGKTGEDSRWKAKKINVKTEETISGWQSLRFNCARWGDKLPWESRAMTLSRRWQTDIECHWVTELASVRGDPISKQL